MIEYNADGEYLLDDYQAILATRCPRCGSESAEWQRCFEVDTTGQPAMIVVPPHPERVAAASNG